MSEVGAGKTTLGKKLAASFNQAALLEKLKKIQNLRQPDIYALARVTDLLIDNDPLFAKISLDRDEYKIYEKVYQKLGT